MESIKRKINFCPVERDSNNTFTFAHQHKKRNRGQRRDKNNETNQKIDYDVMFYNYIIEITSPDVYNNIDKMSSLYIQFAYYCLDMGDKKLIKNMNNIRKTNEIIISHLSFIGINIMFKILISRQPVIYNKYTDIGYIVEFLNKINAIWGNKSNTGINTDTDNINNSNIPYIESIEFNLFMTSCDMKYIIFLLSTLKLKIVYAVIHGVSSKDEETLSKMFKTSLESHKSKETINKMLSINKNEDKE